MTSLVKNGLLFLFELLLLSNCMVECGLFKKDTRNCFCQVYDADTNQQIHDFGSIQSCSGWPTCACRRHEMITCGDECDSRVAGWLSSSPAVCKGRYVKKHYSASTCSEAFGHERRLC